ncbi:MAG TPA: thiamine pyrophosphate-binding protein [Syntrophales bacterium]|nr:thiamine pyrophosphate-binding protein [Syntrophales bacterium]
MAKVTGGQLVAKTLRQIGATTVFTLCGGHIIDIYNGCVDEGIRVIDVRHEQTAAHAAEAWTRLTGAPGVAVVTAGPGVTDAITGIANAFRNQVPMLVIGGQAPHSQLLKGGLQELDHVSITKSITKLSISVSETERIPELMIAALREAYNGRPGPSFVEIPIDVLDKAVDIDSVTFPSYIRSYGRQHGDPALIEEAAILLANAKRPAIIAGTQVWFCRADEELSAFVEKAGIPTYLNGAARGCLSGDCPSFMTRSRRHALSKADVVMVIGTPFDFRLAYGNRIARDAKVIQVDLDYGELGHNREISIGIQGDIKAVLKQFTEAVNARKGGQWLDELCKLENGFFEKEKPFTDSDAVPIHPLRLAKEIRAFMPDDAIFIADGGDVVTMSASVVTPCIPGRWLDPGPLGTLGVGTPFAIAAKAAMPDTEVVVLFGDGAFGLTGFDYDTLIRFGMPVIGIVANNSAWNQVRYGQMERYGKTRGEVANVLAPLRYDRVIEAIGGYGEQVTDPKEIRPALERARKSGKPSLLNVMVDPNVFSSGTMTQSMFK